MAEALIVGLIWLLIYALVIGIICYVVTRLVAQFFPSGVAFTWVIWCIGGLVLLLLAIRLFSPALPS